jgi:tetratricopeptide (TPR) repeat protein
MAYWGEAMTYNHGIWNQLDADAGRKALAKLGPTPAARAAKAPTPRERAYLAAVEILYSGSGTKPVRDARYDEAMAHLAKAWPDDSDAQLFHALALMGRSEGIRDIPAYLRAGAISERVFRLNPRDPGAAHYWIHAMDDPAHAAGALEPARALSKISPAAGHAQHMTSHIFMALGMWDDVVKANEVAVHVVNIPARAEGRPLTKCSHYTQWLEYAYYQQGRFRDAGKALQACQQSIKPSMDWASGHAGKLAETHSTPAMLGQMLNESLMQMRAIAVVESGDGNGFAAHTAVDTTAWIRTPAGTISPTVMPQSNAMTCPPRSNRWTRSPRCMPRARPPRMCKPPAISPSCRTISPACWPSSRASRTTVWRSSVALPATTKRYRSISVHPYRSSRHMSCSANNC